MKNAKKPKPAEENPNLEEHIERHEEDKDMSGHPAGQYEGPESGSRGEQRHHKSEGEWNGSRTNNK